ncbi:hypothetical protein B0H12DRAFT_1155192 [Mycena haematopus]|nr:hypothetical protein B0H12DRAFT_1155192 [Mycena haematopus]
MAERRECVHLQVSLVFSFLFLAFFVYFSSSLVLIGSYILPISATSPCPALMCLESPGLFRVLTDGLRPRLWTLSTRLESEVDALFVVALGGTEFVSWGLGFIPGCALRLIASLSCYSCTLFFCFTTADWAGLALTWLALPSLV